VETAIPPAKCRSTRAQNPKAGRRADAWTTTVAIEFGLRQKDVVGLLLFHSHDERALTGFQSVYYVDGRRRRASSVRTAIQAAGC
jgi:hypothetical protein